MSNNFPLNQAAAAAAVAAATNTTPINPYSYAYHVPTTTAANTYPLATYYNAMSGAAASVAPTTSATIDPSYAAMYQQYQLAAAAAVTNSVDNSANSAATVHAQINYAGHPIAYSYPYSNVAQPIIPAYSSLVQNMFNESIMKNAQQRNVLVPGTHCANPNMPIVNHIQNYPTPSKKRKDNKQHFDSLNLSTEEFFCDICKVYCFGPASYKEHLEGQKHKKKAASVASTNTNADSASGCSDLNSTNTSFLSSNENFSENKDSTGKANNLYKRVTSISTVVLKCQLCNIMCVSADSYRSHIRGAKHQRVSSIQSRMGKPIPSIMPEIVSKNISKALETKILEEFKDDVNNLEHNNSLKEVPVTDNTNNNTKSSPNVTEQPDDSDCLYDVKPIGHDFIEEVLNESGKIVCFTCTLCECRFNDPNAKNLHLKGKRHRLQYKKKVDPTLIVEFIKKDHQRLENDRKSRMATKINTECRIFSVDINPFEPSGRSLRQFTSIFNYSRSGFSSSIPTQTAPPDFTKSFSDLLLEHKHSSIIPRKSELEHIYQCAYFIEKSIRNVARIIDSNFIVNIENPTIDSVTKRLKSWEMIESSLCARSYEKSFCPNKTLEIARVVRVGQLGKGYLLSGEQKMTMVLLCSIFPTVSLIKIFAQILPEVAKEMNSEYVLAVVENENDSSFVVNIDHNPSISRLEFQILLTSPYLRTATQKELDDYPDLLEKHKCLDALSQVRHFRWYKERTLHYQHYNFLVRILRDLCRRVPTWSNLTLWTIELVLERICVSAGIFLPPSALMRHFFEFFSHGICMARGSGLGDPCEEDFPNVFNYLSMQALEDVMSFGQHTLRLIAMRQLNKVLNVDAQEVCRKKFSEKMLHTATTSSNYQKDGDQIEQSATDSSNSTPQSEKASVASTATGSTVSVKRTSNEDSQPECSVKKSKH